jgi:hypothetical protein
MEQGGERETFITISNMFESRLKSTNYSELGRHNSTMGLNSWMDLRYAYTEYWLRKTYPFVGIYYPYAEHTTPETGHSVGYLVHAPYKMNVDANNVSDCNTAGDPNFVPTRGNSSAAGGWLNMSLYMTYATTQDLADIRDRNVQHYANFYYGVASGLASPSPTNDDGYWHELRDISTSIGMLRRSS